MSVQDFIYGVIPITCDGNSRYSRTFMSREQILCSLHVPVLWNGTSCHPITPLLSEPLNPKENSSALDYVVFLVAFLIIVIFIHLCLSLINKLYLYWPYKYFGTLLDSVNCITGPISSIIQFCCHDNHLSNTS